MSKQTWWALGAVLVVSACGGESGTEAPHPSSGGGGSDAGAGADAGTVADGGQVDAGPVDAGQIAAATFQAFTTQFADRYCAFYGRCQRLAASFKAACPAYAAEVIDSQLFGMTSGTDGGQYDYDRAVASACLDALFVSTESCDSELEFFDRCAGILKGRIPDGGTCHAENECGRGECLGAARCQQYCVATGGPGEVCGDGGTCGENLYCAQDGGSRCLTKRDAGACLSSKECDERVAYCATDGGGCTAYPAPGQPCLPFVPGRPSCRAGAYCNFSSVCDAIVDAGEPCNHPAQCGEDRFCYDDGGSENCAAFFSIGQGCDRTQGRTFEGGCREGAYCSAATDRCEPLGAAGTLCGDEAPCGEDVLCDEVSRRCEPVRSNALGERCTDFAVFCEDSFCVGATHNPDGGVGTLGTCRAPQAGDVCTYQQRCFPNLFCNTDAGTDAGPGTCAPAQVGTPCQYDQGCPPGGYCSGSNTCQLFKLSGQPCSPGVERCEADLGCYPSDAGVHVCKPQPDVGEPCDRNQASSACLSGTVCGLNADGGNLATCIEGARPGLPCSSTCFAGKCVPNPDGGALTTCVLQPDGQGCFAGAECASGHCSPYDRQCHSACF